MNLPRNIVAIVIDGAAYRVVKTVQGKRGKGGGFVRYIFLLRSLILRHFSFQEGQ